MKRTLLLYLVVAFCAINSSALVHHGESKLDDKLYQYVTLCQKNLKNQGVGLSMLDTLYTKAKRAKNLKVECIALYYRVNYYHLHGKSEEERQEFHRIAPLILRTPYTEYYFRAWNIIIIENINNSNFQEALAELIKFKEEAFRMKNEYGIIRSYMISGDFYVKQHFYRLALPQYRKILALNSSKDDGNLVSLYTRIGQCCMWLHRWDEGEGYLLKAISVSDEFAAVVPRMLLLSLYCRKDVKDKRQVEEAYNMVQKSISTYQALANDYRFYAECMNDYYTLYQHCDSTFKKKFGDIDICVDSLSYYTNKAKQYEAEKNYELSSLYYRKFGDYVNTLRMSDEQCLLSSFVPQMEYWKLKHEKNHWLLRREEINIRQKRGELNLQNLLVDQQQMKMEKQRILEMGLKTRRQLYEQRVRWCMMSIAFTLLFLATLSGTIIYRLRRKQRKLCKETFIAEATERAKNHFYQRVNDKIYTSLHDIVNLNRRLNSEETSAWSDVRKAELMKRLARQSKYLNSIVNNVLDISKIESDTYTLQISTVDVDMLCRMALSKVESEVPRMVSLSFRPSRGAKGNDSSPLLLQTDESRLIFVLATYLSNACRHTVAGSIVLAYDVLPDKIRFSVTDTGQSLSSEERAMIFTRYLSNNTAGNLGLSLYLVSLIAQLLDGRAYADSTTASGACFVLELPLSSNHK